MSAPTFQGKVAIVTGAGIGIGFEIARQLAREGAIVLLNDLDQVVADQAAEKITTAARGVRDVVAKPAFSVATLAAGITKVLEGMDGKE